MLAPGDMWSSWLLAVLVTASPLKLDRLLDEVAESAPQVAVHREQVNAANAGVGVAGAWEDPQVGVMAENAPLPGAMAMADDPMAPMLTYRVMQPLNLFGRRSLAKDAARARAGVAQEELRRAQWDARSQAVMGFYDLWMNDQMNALLGSQLLVMTQMKESARARYVAGMMMGHHDLLRATAEIATMNAERASLADERAATATMINTLRKRPVDEPIGQAELEGALPLPELSDLRALAARSPEVVAAQRMREEMTANQTLSRRMYLPMVMVEGFYQQRLNAMPNMFGGSINFTVPLWFVDRQRNEVEMADAMLRRAERDVDAMEAMSMAQLQSAFSRAKAAERALAALEQGALPALRETVDADRAAYVAGTASFIDLLESLSALREAEMKRIASVVRRDTTRFELQRLVATPLDRSP